MQFFKGGEKGQQMGKGLIYKGLWGVLENFFDVRWVGESFIIKINYIVKIFNVTEYNKNKPFFALI